MQVSAVIGVKDEAKLLGPCCGALLRAGISSIWVLDDGSTDGTLALLEALSADPRIKPVPVLSSYDNLLHMDGPLFAPILAQDQPDWVLFTDADEMWLTAGQRPVGALAQLDDYDVLSIGRYNAAPLPGGIDEGELGADATLRALELITQRQEVTPASIKKPDQQWILHNIPPKVMARPSAITELSMGGHRAVGDGLRRGVAEDIIIAHLPFTSYDRFAQKVRNAAAMFEGVDMDALGMAAWHWQHWVRLAEAGQLADEFARQVFDEAMRAGMRRGGGLMRADQILGAAT